MAHQPTNSIEEHIKALRTLLKPEPVRQGRIPQWLQRRVRNVQQRSHRYIGEHLVDWLQKEFPRCGHWIDHWGTITRDYGEHGGKRQLFVSEPYDFCHEDFDAALNFARACDLRVWVEANSWWYPGWTVRIVFAPKGEE